MVVTMVGLHLVPGVCGTWRGKFERRRRGLGGGWLVGWWASRVEWMGWDAWGNAPLRDVIHSRRSRRHGVRFFVTDGETTSITSHLQHLD